MSVYTIVVKKGKYELNLSTSDREFVVAQFELWIKKTNAYATRIKTNAHKNAVNAQIQAEEEITKKNIEEQIAKHNAGDTEQVLISQPSEPKYKTKEKDNDLDIFYAPPMQEHIIKENETLSQIADESSANPVFDSILENSLKNPQTELSFKPSPSIKKDTAFLNFMGSRNIEKKLDYLLNTAYYFTQYEQRPRFTVKQLNAKLMQNLAVIVDHSAIQEGINRNYIECLPDLTGVVGASEYRLTAYGEKVLLDE